MDCSQAEQGEAETLHLLGTNLHQLALAQYKGQVGSCLQDSEAQSPQTPAVHDQTWLYPCREGRGVDTSQFQPNPGKEGSFPSAISEPISATTVSSAGVCVWAGLWMMGLMLQGVQEMGKNEGMRLLCLPCSAILGSSTGCKSHHSNPQLPTPSFHLPAQNILLAL